MDNIHTQIKVCKNCQRSKKQGLKYAYLPAKEVEAIPWDRLSVDITGRYKISIQGHSNPLILKDLTMIDLATGWFEIIYHYYHMQYLRLGRIE